MRDLLNRADLDRYAGQFVWLELNYDMPENQEFLAHYGVSATPTHLVIDPQDENVVEMQTGAMSLEGLKSFLDRGMARTATSGQSTADTALKQGDALRASHPDDAAVAYRRALSIAPASWPDRELAESSLVSTLSDAREWQECAQTAAGYAAHMSRGGDMFARTVIDGLWCALSDKTAGWTTAVEASLQPLAEEALSLPTTVRDHRNELYRTLMMVAVAHHDNGAAAKWSDHWLAELDAIKPASDDERSALDIARVENIQEYGDANRILPALLESEKAMPKNYVASLRLAQAELLAKRYDDAVAAIDRGLARKPGAMGKSWLLQMKADVLSKEGKTLEARRTLQTALEASRQIPSPRSRNNAMERITKQLNATVQR
jgi:tetratricopeptide (TPR) repeat protein